MKNESKKILITTPIYYPNDNLHIGHAYTTSLADILSRFKKLDGYEVMFVTGSDEHGQKLYDKAKEANKNTKDYIDPIVDNFKNLWNKLNINYDVFVRTTDLIHKENVQKIFLDLRKKGFIYKGKYSGFYCKSDEAYFTKNQLVNNNCPLCKREVVVFEEDSFFLKTSDFQKWIKNKILSTDLIYPKSRINELIGSFLNEDDELTDLSITRNKFSWGVDVPNEKNFVIYVWFDALINYISAFYYPSSTLSIEDWNNEKTEIVQFLGKEIIRFHAIYWPIILKTQNLKLPKLLSHGWLIVDGEKMSKSLGNIIDPLKIIEKYDSDSLRFYFINNISFGLDGKFSEDLLKNVYNGILVNKFSNLINRTFKMNEKYFNCIVPESSIKMKETIENDLNTNDISKSIFNSIKNYDFNKYSNLLIEYLDKLNNYIDLTKPWMEKDENKLKEIIWYLINKIYSISLLFSPVIPNSFDKIKNALKINEKDSFNNLFLNIKNIKIPSELIIFNRKK